MKKTLLFLLFSIVLVGCKEKEEYEEEIIIQEEEFVNDYIKQSFTELNLKITSFNPKEVTQLSIISNNTDNKLIGGKIKDNAWISKFDSNGNEIFYFELKPDLEYKYSYFSNILPIYEENLSSYNIEDNNLVFVVFGLSNDEYLDCYLNYTREINGTYCAYYNRNPEINYVLFAIDLSKGEELNRFSINTNNIGGHIFSAGCRKTSFSYYIDERGEFTGIYYQSKLHCIGFDGKYLWNRLVEGDEIYLYYSFFFNVINNSTAFFLDNETILQYNNNRVRSINIREYELNFETESIILYGDRTYTILENGLEIRDENISYSFDKLFLLNGNARIVYNEILKKEVSYDPILNIHKYEYETVDKYFYDLDVNSGNILNHGKIE
jgi:hypothetical protein